MGEQLPSVSRAAAGLVAILSLTAACMLVVECKPTIIIKNKRVVMRDDLLALPSETQYTTISNLQYNQQPPERYPSEIQPQVEYVLQLQPRPEPSQPPHEVAIAYEPPKPHGQVEMNAVEYVEQQQPLQPHEQVIYVRHDEVTPYAPSPDEVYIFRSDGQLVPQTLELASPQGNEGSAVQQQAGYEHPTSQAPVPSPAPAPVPVPVPVPTTAPVPSPAQAPAPVTASVTQDQQLVVPNEANQQQQHQYNAPEQPMSREYPGEIIYFENQQPHDDERPSAEPQAIGSQYENNGNHSSQLMDAANLLYKNSGLPATILTEVPVKDMPKDVLDRLKREFGVKVVATREQPGANLVINCDEYSGLAYTICSKKPAAPEPTHPLMSYPYAPAEGDSGATLEEPAREQPHHPINEITNAEHHEYLEVSPPTKATSPTPETHYKPRLQPEAHYNKERENSVVIKHKNDETNSDGLHKSHRARHHEANYKRREGNHYVRHHNNQQVNHNVSRHVNHHESPYVSRHDVPRASHYDVPHASHHDRPHASHHDGPHTSHYDVSQSSHHNVSHTSHHDVPHISHYDVPHASHLDRPHASHHDGPHTSHHTYHQASHQDRPHASHHDGPRTSHYDVSQSSHHNVSHISHHDVPPNSQHNVSQSGHRDGPHASHRDVPHASHHDLPHANRDDVTLAGHLDALHASHHDGPHASHRDGPHNIHNTVHQASHNENLNKSEHFNIEAFLGSDQKSVTSPEDAHERLQNDHESTSSLEPRFQESREDVNEEQSDGEEQSGFDIQTPNPSEEFKPSEEDENQH